MTTADAIAAAIWGDLVERSIVEAVRLVGVVLLMAVGCDPEPATPPRAAPPAAATATATARKDCRDLCEQNAIVAGRGDEQIRACRARCDGTTPGAAAPPARHEVPARITAAPPAHAPPNVRPARPSR